MSVCLDILFLVFAVCGFLFSLAFFLFFERKKINKERNFDFYRYC